MFNGKASSGTWRIVVGLVFSIMILPGAILAQESPRPRPGDSLPRPSPGYTYSRGEIDAAKADLALMLEDAEATLDTMRDHFIGQLGPGFSPMTVQLDEMVEESRLEILATWQTFDALPDQNLPIVVYQSRDFARKLAAQTEEIKSAISQGGEELVSDIATEFEKEERFTSDQELTQMEGTLLNELSALRELTCNLERLMFVHMQRRYKPSSACAATTSASSTSSGVRGEPAPPARGISGRDRTARARNAALSRQDPAPPDSPASVFTGELQVEKALLDERPTPALYLPARKGGGIEQVSLLVWATIEAQEELGIAPTETSLARDIAAKADSLLAQSDYIAAFRTYSSAYRTLVPAP